MTSKDGVLQSQSTKRKVEANQNCSPIKEYVGFIWIGDAPGLRISVWARTPEEAMQMVEDEYGKGHPYSIRNLEDSRKELR